MRQDRLVVVLNELPPDVGGGAGKHELDVDQVTNCTSKAAICATVKDILQVENLRISGAFVKYCTSNCIVGSPRKLTSKLQATV